MDYQTTKMMQGLIRTKTLSMDERKAMYQQLRIEMLEKKPMLQKKYANLPLTGYKTLEEYTNAMETIFLEADEDGQLLSMMLETQKDNQELFEHSVEVWYVSLFLIEQIDHIKDGTVNQKKLYEKEIVATGIAALLHDLGKCKNYITAEQAEHMNRIERANYREHVIQGNAILKGKQMDTTIMQGVLQHHECYDGSGFPMGIKGGNLGTIAKVIGLADFYVHVMAHEIGDPFELVSVLTEKESKFDLKYLQCLWTGMLVPYQDKEVLLSNGKRAILHGLNQKQPLKSSVVLEGQIVRLENKEDLTIVSLA